MTKQSQTLRAVPAKALLKSAIFGLTTMMVIAMTACNQAPDTHAADVKAIQDNEAQWNQDFAAKDLEKIAAHYADDAVFLVSGMPATSGKDAIHASLQQMISDPGLALKFQAARVDVAKSGDLAYTQGSYTLTATDPATRQVINDRGSYVTTYRKQPDGAWKAVVDIVSSEVPPPAPSSVPSSAPAKKH